MKSIFKSVLLIIIFAFSVTQTNAKPDDLEIVKERAVAEVLKTIIDDGEVETIINKMNQTRQWFDLWYKFENQ